MELLIICSHARIHGFLPRIENLAKSKGGYLVNKEAPCMGDYFMLEAMDLISMVLGKVDEVLLHPVLLTRHARRKPSTDILTARNSC
eukprot:192308-Hanusia_phi.AAC.3